MRNLICGLLCICVLASCQKEVNGLLDSNPPNEAPKGTLARVVNQFGTDSSVETYAYDASSRLTFRDVKVVASGVTYPTSYRLIRNSSGVITQIIVKDTALSSVGVDSVTMTINYNSSLAQYTSKTYSVNLSGIILRDSVSYVYNSAGKIQDELDYNNFGLGYTLVSKWSFIYTGSNLTELDGSAIDSAGVVQPSFKDLFQYDNNPSPLVLKDEAILINAYTGFSANNVLKSDYVDLTDPSASEFNTVIYTYRADGKPATAVDASNPTGGLITYYYN